MNISHILTARFPGSKCEHCPLTNPSSQGAQNRRRFAHNGARRGRHRAKDWQASRPARTPERHLCIRKSLLNNRLLLPHLRPRARCCAVHCPAKGRSGDASGNSNPTATECELRTRRVRWFHGSSASILIRNECPSPLKVQALTGRVGRQQNAQWIFRGIGVEPTLNVFAVRATREAINYLDALSPPVH